MIRATELAGRAVVDRDAAQKLGRVDHVVLDPDNRRVAGFIVAHGSSLMGHGTHMTIPASAVHAIGPDAITVRRPSADDPIVVEGLPRVSDLVGRKVVSDDGRFLGVVDDVLIDPSDGRIVGYTLDDPDVFGKLEALVGARKEHHRAYLRADADIRAGRDLIVAPADAVVRDEGTTSPAAGRSSTAVSTPTPPPPAVPRPTDTAWAQPTPVTSTPNAWVRNESNEAWPDARPERSPAERGALFAPDDEFPR